MAVIKSTDGGVHWTDKTAGLPSGERSAVSLGLDPTDPNIVYVSGYAPL